MQKLTDRYIQDVDKMLAAKENRVDGNLVLSTGTG